jgi:hypothetical protein
MSTSNSGRKAAQRMLPVVACERCGGRLTLQRHHKDRNPTNNAPSNLEVLCQTCHKAEHMTDGTWGLGRVEPAICKVCSRQYQPTRTGRSTVCSPACHVEWGRISAARRWSTRQEQHKE